MASVRSSRRKAEPREFASARRAFQKWRRTRSGPTRIPEPLWASAVRLARRHGVNPTARALGLDYYSLKRRVDSTQAVRPKRRRAPQRRARKPRFVELPVPTDGAKRPGCAVVLEKPGGERLRVELDSAPDAESLAAIASALLGVGQ